MFEANRLSSPLSTLSDLPSRSALSSPFPTKPLLPVERQKSPFVFPSNSNSPRPKVLDDVFSTDLLSLSTPPPSPIHPFVATTAGEIHRGRQDNMLLFKRNQDQRPEFLRTKRSFAEIEEQDPEGLIGIAEGPLKERRPKIFHETSEDSFEESLMTDGYNHFVSATNKSLGELC